MVNDVLKIQPNSRQIPRKEEYTSSKMYCDLVYGYLQQISILDIDGSRYLEKRQVNFSKIGKELEMTRQTVKKYFELLGQGLIDRTTGKRKGGLDLIQPYDEEKKRYYLSRLEPSDATLIPFETLQFLTDTVKERSISTYVYLINRYFSAGKVEFVVTMNQIKQFIGIAFSTTSNNHIVTNILVVLNRLGLVDYELRQVEVNKTVIVIKKVGNLVDKSVKNFLGKC